MCLEIPGRVVEITDAVSKLGVVDVCVRRQLSLACVVNESHSLESCVGDWVLVHVGFAMNRIDEREAQLTLELLKQLREAQTEIEAMRATH